MFHKTLLGAPDTFSSFCSPPPHTTPTSRPLTGIRSTPPVRLRKEEVSLVIWLNHFLTHEKTLERYIHVGTFLLHQNRLPTKIAHRLCALADLAPRFFAEKDDGRPRDQPQQPPRCKGKERGFRSNLLSGVEQQSFDHSVSPLGALPLSLGDVRRKNRAHADGAHRTSTSTLCWSPGARLVAHRHSSHVSYLLGLFTTRIVRIRLNCPSIGVRTLSRLTHLNQVSYLPSAIALVGIVTAFTAFTATLATAARGTT